MQLGERFLKPSAGQTSVVGSDVKQVSADFRGRVTVALGASFPEGRISLFLRLKWEEDPSMRDRGVLVVGHP